MPSSRLRPLGWTSTRSCSIRGRPRCSTAAADRTPPPSTCRRVAEAGSSAAALLTADALSLILAYLLAKLVVSGGGSSGHPWLEFGALLLTLPLWTVAAKLYGLYDRDEEHVDHSTIDEVVGVFHLVTLGAWFFFIGTWWAGVASRTCRG